MIVTVASVAISKYFLNRTLYRVRNDPIFGPDCWTEGRIVRTERGLGTVFLTWVPVGSSLSDKATIDVRALRRTAKDWVFHA